MTTFRFLSDLDFADLLPPVRLACEQALSILLPQPGENFHYCPDEDGYVVLIEQKDTPEMILDVLGYQPESVPWEGGYYHGEILVGIMLRNNQFGLTVVIPADCNHALRASLLDAM